MSAPSATDLVDYDGWEDQARLLTPDPVGGGVLSQSKNLACNIWALSTFQAKFLDHLLLGTLRHLFALSPGWLNNRNGNLNLAHSGSSSIRFGVSSFTRRPPPPEEGPHRRRNER